MNAANNNPDAPPPPTLLQRLHHNDPTLKQLAGFGQHSLSEICHALRTNTTVSSFKFHQVGLDDEACRSLMDALIYRRQGGDGRVCEGCCERMERVSLARNRVGLDGALSIAEFIRVYSGHSEQLQQQRQQQQQHTNNSGCDASDNSHGGRFKHHLCEKCQKKKNLSRRGYDEIELNLLQNALGDNGVIAISDAIHNNYGSVSIKNNAESSHVNSGEDDPPSSCIVELGLERNNIGDAAVFSISKMLRTNNNLHTLRLGKNCITYEGISKGLAPALKVNKTLEVLSLMGNEQIGDRGAKALGDALRSNQTLTNLLLAKCGISDIGVMCILKALYNDDSPMTVLEKSNHSLKDVSLCSKNVLYIPGSNDANVTEGQPNHKLFQLRNERNKTSISLKELIIWNKYGPGTARRLKLQFFLCSSRGPQYVNASDFDGKLLPMLFYRLWKIIRNEYSSHLPAPLGVLYSYMRGMPDLLEH